jgi:phosphoribosyl-ATP pyrophosphohydrolase
VPAFTLSNPEGVHHGAKTYSLAALVDPGARRLVISGQVGTGPDGHTPDDAAGQVENIYANLRTILQAHGMELANLVKITAFLTDRAALGPFRQIRDRVMAGHAPASTVVIVSASPTRSTWSRSRRRRSGDPPLAGPLSGPPSPDAALHARRSRRARGGARPRFPRPVLHGPALAAGPARPAKKLGEEAIEAALAAVAGDRDGLVAEAADVLYHLVVLLRAGGVGLEEVMGELERRRAQSGLAEKASRGEAGA